MKFVIAVGVSVFFGLAGGSAVRAQGAPQPTPDGACPSGWHIVGPNGEAGIAALDDFEVGDLAQHRCELDQSPTSLTCGAHGVATAIGGIAACDCATGYAGAACNVCAAGYEMTGSAAPVCTPIAVNRDIALLGGERIVRFGGQTTLSAQLIVPPRNGSSPLVTGVWRLAGDPAVVGCVAPVSDASNCTSAVTGAEALYFAPAQGSALTVASVTFAPAGGGPTLSLDLKNAPYEEISINGYADGDVLPVVYKLLDFMKVRCIGAASLGIAKNGKVVAALGFGMKDGRNAETLWNPGCSSDAIDPYKPLAGEMDHDTPMLFGSVSKPTAFAVARWAIKGALAAQDADVRVIEQSANRAVSASRLDDGSLRVEVWDVNATGTPVRRGTHTPTTAKDFALVRISDTRFVVIARTATDTFRMYAYSVNAAGAPTVVGSIIGATKVKEVEIAAITGDRLVIAMRRDNDALQVRSYKIEATGALTQLDLEDGGIARSLRLVALPGTSRVVGAARLGSTDVVKFIVWNVDATGQLTRIHETLLDNYYWEIGKLDMTALSSGRFVVASRGPLLGSIEIAVHSVDGTGAIAQLGATGLATQQDFRLQRIDSTRFAVASRDTAGNGTVRQFAVSAQGAPTQIGNGTVGGRFQSLDVAGFAQAGFGAGFVTATRDQNDVLRFNAWSAGANAIVKVGTASGDAPVKDYAWTDADVEALRLVGYDFPDGLAPKRLHDVLAGYVQPPMHFDATDARTGATCTATAAAGYPYADAKWKNIKLGNLFAHRAGLNVSTISGDTLTRDHLDEIRGIATTSDWDAEQNKVIASWGAQNVQNARTAIELAPTVDANAPDGFLVPQLSLEEILLGSASMCLPNTQGVWAYSNTDPSWVRVIAEHVTGKPYVAPVGQPTATAGTLLDDFFKSEFGISSNGYDGVAGRTTAIDGNGNDPWPGARPRLWHNGQQTYYPLYWDTKRPYCRWENGTCDFDSFSAGDTLNWNGVPEQVPLQMDWNGHGAATGELTAQIVPQLRLMGRYWSGGYTEDPYIGEARRGVTTVENFHDGRMDGAYAYALQYGGNTCPGSEGVDIIVAVNQTADPLCRSSATCAANPPRYGGVRAVIDAGVCLVDWTRVSPIAWLND